MSTRLFSGLCVSGATLAALVLGALLSVIWNGAAAPFLARILTSVVEPTLLDGPVASVMSRPDERYFTHGRWTLAVYALMWFGAISSWKTLPSWARLPVTLGAVVATAGDAFTYWVSESAGPGLRRIAFWYLELPALALVALLLSAVGVEALVRGRATAVWLFATPAALLGAAVIQYLPHGVLLGLSATLLLAALRATKRSLPRSPTSAR